MPIVDLDPLPLGMGIDRPEKGFVTPGIEETHERPSMGELTRATFRRENLLASAAQVSNGIDTTPDPDFKPFDQIKGTPYERHFNAFLDVQNRPQFDEVKRRLDQEDEDRKIVDAAPLWMSLPASLMANVTDPTILAPGGAFVRGAKGGWSMLKSGTAVGAAAAGATAGQEAFLHGTQLTRTPEESAFNVGSSFILAGLLGTGGSALLNRAEWKSHVRALDRELANTDTRAIKDNPVTAPIYEDIANQLRATKHPGMTEDYIEKVAALTAARYQAKAERLGGSVSAEDLYKAQGIEVRGTGAAPARPADFMAEMRAAEMPVSDRITLRHDPTQDFLKQNPNTSHFDILRDGERIGRVIVDATEDGELRLGPKVDEQLRRQGIATEVYNALEARGQQFGLRLEPSFNLSKAAFDMWRKRDPSALRRAYANAPEHSGTQSWLTPEQREWLKAGAPAAEGRAFEQGQPDKPLGDALQQSDALRSRYNDLPREDQAIVGELISAIRGAARKRELSIEDGVVHQGTGARKGPLEKLKSSYVKVGDEVFEGPTHGIALLKAEEKLGAVDYSKLEQGFVTTGGHLVNKEEAGRIADLANQRKTPDEGGGKFPGTTHSEDMKFSRATEDKNVVQHAWLEADQELARAQSVLHRLEEVKARHPDLVPTLDAAAQAVNDAVAQRGGRSFNQAAAPTGSFVDDISSGKIPVPTTEELSRAIEATRTADREGLKKFGLTDKDYNRLQSLNRQIDNGSDAAIREKNELLKNVPHDYEPNIADEGVLRQLRNEFQNLERQDYESVAEFTDGMARVLKRYISGFIEGDPFSRAVFMKAFEEAKAHRIDTRALGNDVINRFLGDLSESDRAFMRQEFERFTRPKIDNGSRTFNQDAVGPARAHLDALTAAGTDRPAFEAALSALTADKSMKLSDLKQIASGYLSGHVHGANATRADVLRELETMFTTNARFKNKTGLAQIGSEGPRGRITLQDNKAIIDLFESADKSTFLHEMGHKWLDELASDAARADVPQALKDDLGTVLRWLGVDNSPKEGMTRLYRAEIPGQNGTNFTSDLSQAHAFAKMRPNAKVYYVDVPNDLASALPKDPRTFYSVPQDIAINKRPLTVELGVKEHEQWAKAFERYLAEGKAPSSALAQAFESFKQWLVSIYKSLTNIDATITDEIRGVMDRLIATDAEIKASRAYGPGSVGAAATSVPSLGQTAIAGRVAGGAAAATQRLNPGLRLAHSEVPEVRDIGMNLAEMSQYIRGNQDGLASPIAVETLRKEWNGGLMNAVRDTREAYKDYRKGGGNLSRPEFQAAVGRAMRRGDEDPIPEVAKVAKAWRKEVFDPLKEAAIEAKLLPKDVDVETAISYFSRLWNREKLIAQERAFKDVVMDWVAQNFPAWERAAAQATERRLEPLRREIDDLEMAKLRRGEERKLREDEITAGEFTEADIRNALRIVQGGAPKPKGVKTLTQFLVENGGLYDPGGDVRHMGINPQSRPGLLRKERKRFQSDGGGLGLDEATQKAWDAGYFPDHTERPTIHDFLEALSDDFNKRRAVVRHGDQEAYRLQELIDQIDQDLARVGASSTEGPRFSTSEETKGIVDRVFKAMDAEADRRLDVLKKTLKERETDARLEHEARFGNPRDAGKGIADEVFNTLTGRTSEGVRPEFITIKARGPLKERTFNIPDELVERWLEDDVDLVGRRYQRIMSADVELARKFGSVDMADQIAKVHAGYDRLREGVTDEKRLMAIAKQEKADIRDLEGVRDIIRGTYAQSGWEKDFGRVVRIANNVQYILKMGQVVLSSLTEPVRVVAAKGLIPFMGDAFKGLSNPAALKASIEEARLAGNINDKILAHRLSTVADLTDFYGSRGPVEKALDNMTNVASSWNGIRLWTDGVKMLASTMIQNKILRTVAEYGAAKDPDKRYLNFLGINQGMAERISKQFNEHGDVVNGVHVAGTEKWTDEVAKRHYRAALNKDLDSMVVTRGAADLPLFANTPLGRLIFQFNTFNLASHQRILLRGLQEGHARFLSGVVALASMGMLQTYLAALATNSVNRLPDFETNKGWWISEGLDRSGLFMLPMQIANGVEKLTGINPIKSPIKAGDEGSTISQKNRNRNELGVLGPTAGTIQDIGTAVGIPKTLYQGEDVKQSQKNALERLFPFNSYAGLRQILKYFVNPPTE